MKRNILFVILFSVSIISAQSTFNPDTVKAGKYDTGTMWAFEFPPFEYLKQVYNFKPTQEWFDNVRLSAVRIPGCSASFVSNDGLIMTNNHCADGTRSLVQKPGEDLEKTGFIAATLEEERKIPNFIAEQLIYIKDVTKEVLTAMKNGKTEKQKIALRDTCINQLAKKYSAEQKLNCQIISYYNGGVYYVQGYKVFTDVRYVFQPEEQTASFGRDPDNFTYPRYGLDCAFFRVYENGKPYKSDNYFKWSSNGAAPGELVFTVGNPGTTNRLRTVAQLEYMRDIQYRNYSFVFDIFYKKLDALKSANPSKAQEYEDFRLGFSNSWKSIIYTYKALSDPYLIARKKAFEKTIQEIVKKDPVLKKEYGHVWKTIEGTRKELRGIDTKLAAYAPAVLVGSVYQTIASVLVNRAKFAKLTQEQKDVYQALRGRISTAPLNRLLNNLDPLLEQTKMEIAVDYLILNLGSKDPLVKKYFQGKTNKEIAASLIEKSLFKNKQAIDEIEKKTPDEILKLDDPFIQLYAQVFDKTFSLVKKQKEVRDTENVAFSLLGQIMFKIYGTSIPPDANRTLRLSDGILKSYDYNGTTAPIKTTFYGLYDRFYGNDGKYPFNLASRWEKVPEGFDLSTPYNFISTNDIIGGNSGSPVINKNAEVIGLAFDGNVESMEGNFIYRSDANRTVSVDSKGLYEAVKKVYKADRLANELKTGKLAN